MDSTDINVAKSLLESYGIDSLSYFSLHEKKKYFFSSTGQSFLSYTVYNKTVLVSGNPSGPLEEMPNLLKEFSYFSKGAGLTSCFLGVSASFLPFLSNQGHRTMYIGNEAVISLLKHDKGLLKKKVRRAEKHIQKLGIVSLIYKRSNIPNKYFNQIADISTDWLECKKEKQKGYSMTLGRIPSHFDKDCEIVLAVKDEEVLGYLILVPAYAANALSLDASRRRNNAPNGLTEFMLLQAFDYYQKKQISSISLNFATFYHKRIEDNKQLLVFFTHIVYKVLSKWFKTNQLYSFNSKFLPDWQERYITFEKRRHLPLYLLAISKAEL